MLGTELDDRIHASAAPDRVRVVIDRLIGQGEDVVGLGATALEALVAVAGASDSLGDLLVENGAARDVLGRLDRPVELGDSSPEELRRTHRLELLRIAARDLLDLDDLWTTVEALSDLAAGVLVAALDLAGAETLGVIGMGKLGACELNVVSDVDVLFVSAGDPEADERAARRALPIAGGCFRVDTGLRPQGRDGVLVRTVDSYAAHWERWASAWEFQALLKARPVAGPPDTVDAFASRAATALWDRPFGSDDLRELRRLKARAEAEVAVRGLTDREIKRGPGGIRDIEFSVQLLQLVHGSADPSLRERSTRGALHQLEAGGYVDPDEAGTLLAAYEVFRRVEHRLQLVGERQTHTVPAGRAQRRRIARAAGYRGRLDAGPTEQFDHDLAMHRLAVRRVHEGWYFRPLLDAYAGAGSLAADVSAARLRAFGFRDADRTRQAVRELATGLTRSSRLMRQLLPLVLDWLADGPDPDLGLLGLRRLASGDQRTMALVAAFRDSPERARRLCGLVTVSPMATEILVGNPDLVERLDDPLRLETPDRDALAASAWQAAGWRTGPAEQRAALHRWYRRQLLGIVARDVAGAADVGAVGADLTVLAEVVIETAVRLVDSAVPLAVIGMGRLGGAELSYASDVDLVFVFDGAGDARPGTDLAEAERAVAAVLNLVRGPTPANRVLDVDVDLRPEGRLGPLARSLDSYSVYLDRWADVWERQALLRSRPVAGDVAVGRRFASLVEHALWSRPPTTDDRRAVRRMKARVEAERIPKGIEARRHLKLGPGALADVEWTVQLLQWTRGVRHRSTLGALARLEAIGALDAEEAGVLAEAHTTCDLLRNRCWLVFGEGDVLPEQTDALSTLARSLDGTGPHVSGSELVDVHRRLTRRSRKVVTRRLYESA